MDIISYIGEEVDSKRDKYLSKLTRTIKKLSNQYNSYKEIYKFPIEHKSIYLLICMYKFKFRFIFFIEFVWMSQLHYIRISFDTPKFEKITKDIAAKWTDRLSAIGGTMGLLTGFSIISGVEMVYFALKITLNLCKKILRKQKIQD